MSKIIEKIEENNKKIKELENENVFLDGIRSANALWKSKISYIIDKINEKSEKITESDKVVISVLKELLDTKIFPTEIFEEGE